LETNKCIYIIDKDYIILNHQKFYPHENNRLNLFLEDPTIRINSTKNFIIEDKGLNKRSKFRSFRFYEYKPLFNQPCYKNSSNTFPTTPKDEKLLEDYYQFQKNDNKVLEKKITLNPLGEIKALKLVYIYSDKQVKYPIRFQINLQKNVDSYHLKINVDFYSWGIDSIDQFIFKELTLHLLNIKIPDNKESNSNKLEIISKNSWISNGLGVNREKFNWYRNYKIDKDYNFSPDNFGVKITGKLDFI
jgi:hypothetical protein